MVPMRSNGPVKVGVYAGKGPKKVTKMSTHTHTFASSGNQPAAAAAQWVRVLQQGHQFSLQQAEVLILAAVTLPLQ